MKSRERRPTSRCTTRVGNFRHIFIKLEHNLGAVDGQGNHEMASRKARESKGVLTWTRAPRSLCHDQAKVAGQLENYSSVDRRQSGSGGGRASNYTNTNGIGATICGTNLQHVCRDRALITSRSKVPLDYCCTPPCDTSTFLSRSRRIRAIDLD